MSNHNELKVWKRSHALVVRIHLAARSFPSKGAPGLKSPLLRAVAAIPAKSSDAQFIRFLDIAIGSANEGENHLLLSHALGMLTTSEFEAIHDELQQVRKMMFGLRKTLKD